MTIKDVLKILDTHRTIPALLVNRWTAGSTLEVKNVKLQIRKDTSR